VAAQGEAELVLFVERHERGALKPL
jgi:hypothetical protein